MGVSEILATIDREIAQLQQARTLLSGGAAPVAKRRPGRPRKTDVAVISAVKPAKKKKRNISPAGRKRIAEAVKKRWAKQKAKAAAPKKAAMASKKAVVAKPARKKRKLSAEGRKRIAEAARKRWEAQRAAAAS